MSDEYADWYRDQQERDEAEGHRCGWDFDPGCDGCRVAYRDAGMDPDA
jgi:hypothetical protein